MKQTDTVLGYGNPDEVRKITLHLLEAFDQLAEKRERPLQYIDVLLGFHNAYKRMIVHMEKETGQSFREIAIDTLRSALPHGTTGYIWDTQVLE